MKRLDPAAVAAWFLAHPMMRVLRCRFAAINPHLDNDYRGMRGCCGLTSRVADLPGFPLDDLDDAPGEVVTERLAAALDLKIAYAEAFAMGWDGMPLHGKRSVAERTGLADGLAAYKATMEARRS